MKELLKAMSSDMDINRYSGESNDSFVYRLIYSALGQWCLKLAQSNSDGKCGTSKHNQTLVLNEQIMRYEEFFPGLIHRFTENNDAVSFPVHVRRVYEETGYLLTDGANRNTVAIYGRGVAVGNATLYFGIPNKSYTVNGLGIIFETSATIDSLSNFLLRDELSPEDYFLANYNIVDFTNKEIDIAELEFFNPLLPNAPSSSWSQHFATDCSVARRRDLGTYYRVMKDDEERFLFADDDSVSANDSFTSYDYRRLYFALKTHYGNPLKAQIEKLDKNYCMVRVSGYLPNREYYLLLLLSWPMDNAFNKVAFLVKSEFIQPVKEVLGRIGIEIEEK